ncbi:hypothetical protein SELMODRAFT_412580 [Selaginella moellendorffii]|uniref:RAP domain-containing protein n=1 Tax=Selaginella moellendorffii TaxID=88036 RepID=D8RLY2_SELML|nr:hypothetical protein SELMODRAFT_412580 [Selaginella moellendorffii]
MDAASGVPKEFRAQELAQLLWSFGSWLNLWILSWTHRLFSKNKVLQSSVKNSSEKNLSRGSYRSSSSRASRGRMLFSANPKLYQVVLAFKWEGKHLQLGRIEKLGKGEKLSQVHFFLAKGYREVLGVHWKAVDPRGGKVVIEVNRPSHFARNTGDLLGHTVLKHRLVEAAEWKIISASYAEWENLQGESGHLTSYKRLWLLTSVK